MLIVILYEKKCNKPISITFMGFRPYYKNDYSSKGHIGL